MTKNEMLDYINGKLPLLGSMEIEFVYKLIRAITWEAIDGV